MYNDPPAISASIRDLFAAAALAAIDIQDIENGSLADYAELAYDMAAEMLLEKERRDQEIDDDDLLPF